MENPDGTNFNLSRFFQPIHWLIMFTAWITQFLGDITMFLASITIFRAEITMFPLLKSPKCSMWNRLIFSGELTCFSKGQQVQGAQVKAEASCPTKPSGASCSCGKFDPEKQRFFNGYW